MVSHRDALRVELDQAQRALTDMKILRTNGFDDDEHDPDGEPLSVEWSRLESRRRAAAERFAAAEAAIANLDAGRYGRCLDCGNAIPSGRLEALPSATRCVKCVDAR